MQYAVNESPISFVEPGLGWILIILISQFVVGNIILILLEIKDRINFNAIVPRMFRISKSKGLLHQIEPQQVL